MSRKKTNHGIRLSPARRRRAYAQLWDLQRGRCAICGGFMRAEHDNAPDSATFDHMLPWRRGGNNTMFNLVLAHSRCNNQKGDKIIPFSIVHKYLGKGNIFSEVRYSNQLKLRSYSCGSKDCSTSS